MLRGTGKFRIASEYFGLGSTPSVVMVNPAKSMTGLLKTNFFGVQGYAIPTAQVKPLHGLLEAVGNTIRPEQGVVDAFCVVVYPRDSLVITARIAVARCSIPLGARQ